TPQRPNASDEHDPPRPRPASSSRSVPPRTPREGWPRLLDAAEVAVVLNVPTRWITERRETAGCPLIEIGRDPRDDLDDILEWVERQKSGGRPRTFRSRRPVPESGTK